MCKLIFFGLCALLLSGCGGGGGGSNSGDLLEGASLSVSADPTSIGLGDRTQFTVYIDDASITGFILKLRYTGTMHYVDGSAKLNVNGKLLPIEPVSPPSGARTTYVAFYLPGSSFNSSRYGEVVLQLRATTIDDTVDTSVAVDSDVHDPAKDPASEFNSKRPLFSPKDEVWLSLHK